MSGKNLKDISYVEQNRVSMYVVGVVAFQKLSRPVPGSPLLLVSLSFRTTEMLLTEVAIIERAILQFTTSM